MNWDPSERISWGAACILKDFTPLTYDPDRVDPTSMQDLSTTNGRKNPRLRKRGASLWPVRGNPCFRRRIGSGRAPPDFPIAAAVVGGELNAFKSQCAQSDSLSELLPLSENAL